jgi:excinuclease UvrABC ATPase subunit
MTTFNFTSEEKSALLVCPFCSGKPILHYQLHDLDDWVVQCDDCGVSSCPEGIRYDRSLAIVDWNTRITNNNKK